MYFSVDQCYYLMQAVAFYIMILISWWVCYSFDQPLNLEHFDNIRNMACEVQAYARDARILTTYYSGKNQMPPL